MLETIDVIGEIIGRLQENINRLLKELDNNNKITNNPLIMSD